ncbi:MAG: hypothetical protein M3R44_02745 [Candidatus Eremiobacteraeota bacterium]|nr:hypothetical protein [Candidatus Eremiobacteraeota bacterium]
MLWRRLGVSLPLAALTAVLAHGLCFGAAHLPGTVHAASLLGIVAAALVLLALAAFFWAALRSGLAGARQRAWRCASPALLGLGGFGAFSLIELGEGRSPFGGGLQMVAAVAIATAFVWCAARLGARVFAITGRALARFAETRRLWPTPPAAAPYNRRIAFARHRSRSTAQGRAPPLLVPATY